MAVPSSSLGIPRLLRVEECKAWFQVYDTQTAVQLTSLTIVLLHGCGLTSLSFANMVSHFPSHIRFVAYDSRGHGGTRFDSKEDEENLSCENLVSDAIHVLSSLLLLPHDNPLIVLGHSMGGAIATHLVCHPSFSSFPIEGLILLDTIEGAVLNMVETHQIERVLTRPTQFPSWERVLEWWSFSVSKGSLDSLQDQLEFNQSNGCFEWKTDLEMTVPFWKPWFENTSNQFVSMAKVRTKILMVSALERILEDRVLTVAQMQGKFQVLVGNKGGHYFHEISPRETAQALLSRLPHLL